MARILPRPDAEWSPTMQSALAAYRPQVSAEPPSPRGRGGRKPGNLIGTFARYPELANAYLTFNGHVLFASSLSPRLRELVILRVAVRTQCEYQWAQHVPMGAAAGLTDEEIARVVDGPERAGWDVLDQSVLRAVDELLDRTRVSDSTWAELSQHLDEHQLMDLVFTVGAYGTLSMALRSFDVEPDAEIVSHLPVTTGAWDRDGGRPTDGSR